MPLCRVLYAEDNKNYYRLLLGELTPTEGVEIIWVDSIKKLYDHLRATSAPNADKYDCLVLDLNFKGESVGPATFEKVVADYAIPTIIVTADSSAETTRRCLELGAKAVFIKDSEPDLIAAKIIEVVANNRPSFKERLRIGLAHTQLAQKSAQTFAIGYTTAAINIMMISAVAYDFFIQMHKTGRFHLEEWEIYVIGALLGVKGLDSIAKAIGGSGGKNE